MKKYIIIFISFFIFTNLFAKTDSLVFKNGNVIVGQIKNLNWGVIVIETDYSDSDFKIEWEKVAEIYSSGVYIISLSNGERLVSDVRTSSDDKSKIRVYQEGHELLVNHEEMVYIKEVEKGFLDRLSASLEAGFDLYKANNLRSFSTRSNLGYLTDSWNANASFDAGRSAQDSIATTSRTDANLGFNYFIAKSWFVLFSASFLQNDEQKLKLRSTPKAAIGNFVIQTNDLYWGLYGGFAWNNETYTDSSIPDRSDAEANIGTELNMFDMGDLGLLTTLSVYKSINAGKRLRADFKIDLKYDLPLDFYIKLGYTLNYDSSPVEGASENDYVFQTTFGWEL
jgi:hypothetical protein